MHGIAQTAVSGFIAGEQQRMQQLLGKDSSNRSFGFYTYADIPNTTDSMNLGRKLTKLPVVFSAQYVSHHPYDWNDGSLLPAKGLQVSLSTGIRYSSKHLDIQFKPELVSAANAPFKTFPVEHSDSVWKYYINRQLLWIDQPERFGSGNITKLFAGQSYVKFKTGAISFGFSTENLWWGPGLRNSLTMSNTAPGFPHVTVHTNRPVKTGIGTFEGQLIAGQLIYSGQVSGDSSRIFNGTPVRVEKSAVWRYLNGLVITYQPKWVPGLYLGYTRVGYLYHNALSKSWLNYTPLFNDFFTKLSNADENAKDEMTSVFLRWQFPRAHAEFYMEYGRNDNSANLRDFLMEPDHSIAYIVGVQKLFPMTDKRVIQLVLEECHLSTTLTRLIRPSPTWYAHYQVNEGYTNQGQLLGAGIGPGSNSQMISLAMLSDRKKIGFTLERVVRFEDLYNVAFKDEPGLKKHWIDYSASVSGRLLYKKNIFFEGKLNGIYSKNYQWRSYLALPNLGTNVFNLTATVSMCYQW